MAGTMAMVGLGATLSMWVLWVGRFSGNANFLYF